MPCKGSLAQSNCTHTRDKQRGDQFTLLLTSPSVHHSNVLKYKIQATDSECSVTPDIILLVCLQAAKAIRILLVREDLINE